MAQLVPSEVAKRVGFQGISSVIKEFLNVSLYEIIRTNTKTTFLTTGNKHCYRLNYKDLTLGVAEARDNFGDAVVSRFKDAYVKQLMHSISGEQNDLCMYTYSPADLKTFLDQNSHLHYVYLPLTVNATDSANGNRHDMLIIFNNRTKKFYWFDGRNREDYLPLGLHLPKNAMDVLFINFDNHVKCGYSYEPSPSWQITGTLHSYGSIGLLDFIFSTAWCYNAMIMLDYYETPIEYVSVLDSMDEVDRFNFLWSSMLKLISSEHYLNLVPQNAQLDLTASRVPVASPELKQTNQVISPVAPAVIPQREEKTHDYDRYSTELTMPIIPGSVRTSSRETSHVHAKDAITTQRILPESSRESSSVRPEDVALTQRTASGSFPETGWKPMPVVTSSTLAEQQRRENCTVQ